MRTAFAGASRSKRSPRVLVLAGVFAALGAPACTLLNTFDSVKPLRDGGDQVEGGLEASAMGDASDSSVADAAGDSTLGDAGPDGAADAGPPPDKGVIVVGGVANAGDGGVDAGLVSVLTALAPEDGTELPHARERLNVASVQYDGLRDLWYVFESGGAGFFPTPTDPVFLHVRQLASRDGRVDDAAVVSRSSARFVHPGGRAPRSARVRRVRRERRPGRRRARNRRHHRSRATPLSTTPRLSTSSRSAS